MCRLFWNYLDTFVLCCVTQKRKAYKVTGIEGFSVPDSYTKYKIWVSEATV